MPAQGMSSASILRDNPARLLRGPIRAPRTALWRFALRNLLSRPLRTGLALAGLSIPIVGVLGLFCLSTGIRRLVADTVGQIQGILVLRENAPIDLFSELPAHLAARLRALPGVRAAAPQVWKIAPAIEGRNLFHQRASGLLSGASRQPLRGLLNMVQILGRDAAEHARLRSEVYRNRMVPAHLGGGRFLNTSDQGRPVIVISTTIAREFPTASGDPRKVGDRLRIGTRDFTIVGLYDTGSMFLDHTIVMDLTTARSLLNLKEDTVSCFLVEPARPAETDRIAAVIRHAVRGVDARTMSQFQRGAVLMLGTLDRLLLVLLSLALLVGSVGIVNTMLMSTSERLGEFGVMRSCGWSRGDLLRLLLAESIALGLLAGLLGCLLTLAAVSAINPFLDGGIRLIVTPRTLLVGFALALALGTLGGVYPAWRASRLAPMEVIRRGTK